MKRIFLSLLSIILVLSAVFCFSIGISAKQGAEGGSEAARTDGSDASGEIPDNPDEIILTAGLLNEIKEQLKQEILAELSESSDEDDENEIVGKKYHDVTLKEGQLIILHPDSEVIFRGGSAVVITSAYGEGEGVVDLSEGSEIFSGEALQSGHIYLPSEGFAKKAILITGQSAYFTLRGSYEIV